MVNPFGLPNAPGNASWLGQGGRERALLLNQMCTDPGAHRKPKSCWHHEQKINESVLFEWKKRYDHMFVYQELFSYVSFIADQLKQK